MCWCVCACTSVKNGTKVEPDHLLVCARDGVFALIISPGRGCMLEDDGSEWVLGSSIFSHAHTLAQFHNFDESPLSSVNNLTPSWGHGLLPPSPQFRTHTCWHAHGLTCRLVVLCTLPGHAVDLNGVVGEWCKTLQTTCFQQPGQLFSGVRH